MVSFSFLNPLDQPTGRRRLLGELRAALEDTRFSKFSFVVAYAKSGPLLRLESLIKERRQNGLTVNALFGLDQQGTSHQALAFALQHFSATYVSREPNVTFHPKIYIFEGSECGRVFVGSNNLTVGGTETNFEAAMQLDFSLPADQATFQTFRDSWSELLPANCPATKPLSGALLAQLVSEGTVIDETAMQRNRTAAMATKAAAPKPTKSGLALKPPSALPAKKPLAATAVAASVPVLPPTAPQGLAIQIKPHHNGEIFLSVTAALQNPSFFRWPFTGATVPKKAGKAPYPQLTPDPVVNITVYGAEAAPALTLNNYALNTVYYAAKSEIRVTASPLVGVVPDYSIMIIRASETLGIDYEIVIHRPDSPEFSAWLAACNQTMPGGGQTPRKFGWF
jgi:HKD family nuclease